MKVEFLSSLDELRGAHFVLQDERIAYTRFDTMSTGGQAGDVIGSPLRDVIASECIEEVLKLHSRILKGRDKSIFYYNTLSLGKDGSRNPVRCAVWATTYQGKPAIAGVMARITDEDTTASLTRKTSDDIRRLSKGAAKAGEGIATFEKLDGKELSCIYANEEIERVSGYSADELKGLKLEKLFNTKILGDTDEEPLRYESEVLRKDGGITPVELCIGMARMSREKQVTVVYVRDITERRKWEAENLKLQQSLRYYASQVVKAQEEERKRLARELHDSTIQSLLSIYNRLQSVAEHPQRLDDVCGLLEHTISDVRDFTWGLRPPLLDDMGLAPTLRWLVDKMSKNSDLLLEIYIVGEERRLSTNIELSLYRIAQEAISNIQRHAKASTAKVTLTFGKDKVSLSIIDDGCGFNVPARLTHFAGKGKLGIVGMNERSMDIGATIKFESEPGKGTAVNVEVPIPRNELPALYF